MKYYHGLKELAERLHRFFHRVFEGKSPNHKNFKHDYYTSALAYFDRRLDDIDKVLKEVAKQQKYLWQTLEEKNEITKQE